MVIKKGFAPLSMSPLLLIFLQVAQSTGNWVPISSLNMAILKIALSLGPSFTLNFFFTHQCSLSTKGNGLRTKRKSRNIFFMKKNYCTTFTLVTKQK